MKEHNINNYVKFQSWGGESSGKSPQLFYVFDDGVMCLNTCIGEEIEFDNYHRKRNKNGKKSHEKHVRGKSKFSNKYSERIKSIKESDEKFKQNHKSK